MRGGKRAGSGRPALDGGTVRKTIVLSKGDLAFLLSLNPNISLAVRMLIELHNTTPDELGDLRHDGVA